MYQFIPNYVSYVSAKYYWNWFTGWKVIAKINRMNFFAETQCIATDSSLDISNTDNNVLYYNAVRTLQRTIKTKHLSRRTVPVSYTHLTLPTKRIV